MNGYKGGGKFGYLVGWKRIAKFFGIPPSTIRRWHYKFLPIPYWKTHESMQGRVVLSPEIAEKWYRHICELYPNLYRTKWTEAEPIEGDI